jgi:hypothetical protein
MNDYQTHTTIFVLNLLDHSRPSVYRLLRPIQPCYCRRTSFKAVRVGRQGIERFKKAAEMAKDGKLDGQEAFTLWDTFGFPVDLTQLMAEERGLVVRFMAASLALQLGRRGVHHARYRGVQHPVLLYV